MHYPLIKRRDEYRKNRSSRYYSNYKEYHGEISEDCQHRCVYCDIQLVEMGGEGMHLDHFRPRKHFPLLGSDPRNLVLACAKCNILKSDWWPVSKNGVQGFIDPFVPDKIKYFEVNDCGEIIPKIHPSAYIVELLSLNRSSRTIVRRRRVLNLRANLLLDSIIAEMEVLNGQSEDIVKTRLPLLAAALKEVKSLL